MSKNYTLIISTHNSYFKGSLNISTRVPRVTTDVNNRCRCICSNSKCSRKMVAVADHLAQAE